MAVVGEADRAAEAAGQLGNDAQIEGVGRGGIAGGALQHGQLRFYILYLAAGLAALGLLVGMGGLK